MSRAMPQTDVVILGGGLAGSIAAAMLGRASISTTVVDPHERYPADFRCEKLDAHQMQLLSATGLGDALSSHLTYTGALWLVRRGRIADRIPLDQYGLDYGAFVNAVRAEAQRHGAYRIDTATGVHPDGDRQTVALRSGAQISARIVVVASGLHTELHTALGIERRLISRCHTVTLGFDIRRLDGRDFAVPALNYVSDRAEDRMAYLNIFRIGDRMRVNLFTYRDLRDPWLHAFKRDPVAALEAIAPRLTALIGAYAVAGPVRIRPTDLYAAHDYVRPGLVLVGDAFATACPASGTGTQKVLTDVHRLCSVHIPRWLAQDTIDARAIAGFYTDPIKQKADAFAAHKALSLRTLSTGTSLVRRAQRWLRLMLRLGRGTLRGLRGLAEA